MRRRFLVSIAVAVAAGAGVAGYALDVGSPPAGADVLGPGAVSVELGIDHSRVPPARSSRLRDEGRRRGHRRLSVLHLVLAIHNTAAPGRSIREPQ